MAEEQEQYVEEAGLGDDADMGEEYAGDPNGDCMNDAAAEGVGDQVAANNTENGCGVDTLTDCEPKGDGGAPNVREQGPDEAREQELATAEDELQRNQEQEEKQGTGDTEDPMSQPPHGTEVFISKIPREASDSQLKAFCEMAGEVYAMRVPKDRESNTNKGYCFCVFKNREAAEKAMTILEGREVKDFPGRRVNVVPSIVKNKLYIGQMPRDITREELDVLLKAEVVGLEKIELMMDKETNQARGFGFIAFYNNAAATMALRKLSRPEFRLRGHQVQVMWADPKRDEIGTEKVKSIYVGNLPEHYTENDLRSIFTQYGTIDRVTLLYMPDDVSKLRNYAFITYTDRSSAVRAVSEAENNKKHTMADKELLVHMAKPHTQREDGMGGMGMIRGYGSGGYGYHPRGYGPPGRGGGRGPGGRGSGRFGPGGGRGYGGRGYPQADYGYGYEEGYDYGYEEGYEEDYDSYGYGYGYGAYPGMPIMPVVVPSGQFGYVVGGTTGYHEGGGSGSGGPLRRSGGAPAGPGPRDRSAEGRGEGRPGGEYGASGAGYGGGGYGGSSGRGGGGGGGYDDRGYGDKFPSRGEYGSGRPGSYEGGGGHRDAGGYGGGERYYGGGHQGGRGGGGPARGGYGGGDRGGGGGYGERGYGERGYAERGYGGDRSGSVYGAGHYGGERTGGGYGGERGSGSYGAERGGYAGSGGTPSYNAHPPSRGAPGGGGPTYAGGTSGYHGGSGGYLGGSSGSGRPTSYQGGSGSYTGGSGGSRPPAGPAGGGYGGRGGAPSGPRYAPY
ncbi:hypothetical protein Vretimale_4552 [Volvox reticuliferus]|uniref:RRM domain-containing protein n=1 Tax=Volvox reticuliferus TaxID=1737510 RepID=A0A8J4G1I2_9CHLO|nr:hypothetical protein Vretifemale_3170 [Volvox reticuliferus]GIL99370.1 hypothetical protein Vretimale_4552 [Volvox reticuliferus]